jgi:hypothetical protein
MKTDLDSKLDNIVQMAEDARDVRQMSRQKTKERSEGTVEYSRDKSSIKFVEGEDVGKQVRFREENVVFEPFNLREEQEQGFFDG